MTFGIVLYNNAIFLHFVSFRWTLVINILRFRRYNLMHATDMNYRDPNVFFILSHLQGPNVAV